MKKTAIFTVLLLVLSAGSVFAVVDGETIGGETDEALTMSLSNNVTLTYNEESSGLGYAVGTYHSSGTRTYAGSSGDSAIYWAEGTGATIPNAPTGTASANFSNWTSL